MVALRMFNRFCDLALQVGFSGALASRFTHTLWYMTVVDNPYFSYRFPFLGGPRIRQLCF